MIITTFGSGDWRRCGIAVLVSHHVPENVDVERPTEDLVGQCVEIGMVDKPRPASVVDEDVEATETLDRTGDQRLPLRLVADVRLHV